MDGAVKSGELRINIRQINYCKQEKDCPFVINNSEISWKIQEVFLYNSII